MTMTEIPVIVTMQDCPYWNNCNASCCPLDENWKGTHCWGETVCKIALNSEKEGAAERYGDDVIFQTVKQRLPPIRETYHDIDMKIAKAALSPMRMGNGNLRPKRGAEGPQQAAPTDGTQPGRSPTGPDGSAGPSAQEGTLRPAGEPSSGTEKPKHGQQGR